MSPGSSSRPAADDSDESYRRAIGRRLRALRFKVGWSLREAATASGLSHSFIRMVENGESEIAVTRLLRLVESYGAYASDVLSDVNVDGAEFVPVNEPFAVPSHGSGLTVSFLSSPSWMIQPFHVTLEPSAAMTDLHHVGDEFIHGLAGITTVTVSDVRFELGVGDSLVIPEHSLHSFHNERTEPATFVGSVPRSAADQPSPH